MKPEDKHSLPYRLIMVKDWAAVAGLTLFLISYFLGTIGIQFIFLLADIYAFLTISGFIAAGLLCAHGLRPTLRAFYRTFFGIATSEEDALLTESVIATALRLSIFTGALMCISSIVIVLANFRIHTFDSLTAKLTIALLALVQASFLSFFFAILRGRAIRVWHRLRTAGTDSPPNALLRPESIGMLLFLPALIFIYVFTVKHILTSRAKHEGKSPYMLRIENDIKKNWIVYPKMNAVHPSGEIFYEEVFWPKEIWSHGHTTFNLKDFIINAKGRHSTEWQLSLRLIDPDGIYNKTIKYVWTDSPQQMEIRLSDHVSIDEMVKSLSTPTTGSVSAGGTPTTTSTRGSAGTTGVSIKP